jgi:serine/threonine protein kinase
MTQKEFLERYKWNGTKDKIGAGGFGKIFKAKDLVRERYVAIKSSFVGDHKFTLKREVELANELEPNKNILRYENYYRFEINYEEMDYAIMPYYEHGNLSVLIKSGKLTLADKYEITEGILSGVNHLHKNKIVHRDLKPSNILIDRKGQSWIPILADFGLSKLGVSEAESISNSSVGRSLPYAAPEQLVNNGKIGSSTDIWAVGVVIFELFTEKRAFSSSETNTNSVDVELFQKITNARLPTDIESLPEVIRNIINACLVLDHKKRASISELLILIKNHFEKEKQAPKPLDTYEDDVTELVSSVSFNETVTKEKTRKGNYVYIGIAAVLFSVLLFSVKDQFLSGSPSETEISEAANLETSEAELLGKTDEVKEIENTSEPSKRLSNQKEAIKEDAKEITTKHDEGIKKSNAVAPLETKDAESGTGLKIATNKGASKSTFKEGERVTLFYMVNRPSYVRFVYKQADGKLILLDDNLYVPADKLGKWVQTNQFICRPPFGTENLTAYASPEPFEFLGDPGTVLDVPIESITRKVKTRGLVAEKKYSVESKSIAIIIEAKDSE